METEVLRIFDEHRNEMGEASREEVHKLGYWHETFHCWFISKEDGIDYIYFQIRSETKKDYPNLLDITAAGHILAHETVVDGIREINEELGINISFSELIPLGVIAYSGVQEDFIDREFANVFLYKSDNRLNQFQIQREEVSGIVKAEFKSFYELWIGNIEEIKVEGFTISKNGVKSEIDQIVEKHNFVPHEYKYYEQILKRISENI